MATIGGSKRRHSSTALSISAGSARSRASWSGCMISARAPLAMSPVVVSKPAISRPSGLRDQLVVG